MKLDKNALNGARFSLIGLLCHEIIGNSNPNNFLYDLGNQPLANLQCLQNFFNESFVESEEYDSHLRDLSEETRKNYALWRTMQNDTSQRPNL
jgi:hypothetical protein